VLVANVRAELGAGLDEAATDPGRILALGEARVRELELERDRLQPIAGKVDEEKEAEIVAQLAVDAIVVEEVAKVVEDAPSHAVEGMRGMAADEGCTGIEQRGRRSLYVRARLRDHVRSPVRRDEDGVCVDGGDSLAEPLRSRVAAEVGVGD